MKLEINIIMSIDSMKSSVSDWPLDSKVAVTAQCRVIICTISHSPWTPILL